MPALSTHEIEELLDEREHLVRIGTVDDDGHPRVVPTWFVRVGREVQFTPRGTSQFFANIRRDPRVCLSIDEEQLPYRKVAVQGVAHIIYDVGRDDEWRDLYRSIAKRYIPDDAAEAYVSDTEDQPRGLLAVDLDASRVTTWRMPMGEEPATGIWARRYYLPGTHMDELAARGGGPGAYA